MPRAGDLDRLQSQIGRRVAELRAALGITQKELGLRMEPKAHQQFIANIEQGRKNLTLWTLLRLGDGLRVTVGELLDPPTAATKLRIGRPPKSTSPRRGARRARARA